MINIINGVNIYNMSEKNIMDMIYSNPNIFKIIPEKLLTEEICVLYARISSTAIADMPSKFYTDDVITNYIHYWGYLNQLSFVKDINVDEMIAKTIIKFSSRTNIDLASITTGVLDYLIEHEEDSLYLTYSGSYNLFRKDNNLMKLHDKYGVSFLKNIRMNISRSFYIDIYHAVPECHFKDFTPKFVSEDARVLMLKRHMFDILDMNGYGIPSEIIDKILEDRLETYYDKLINLTNREITSKQAQLMKQIPYFKITDIPSDYVSSSEYMEKITDKDDITRISIIKLSPDLTDKIIAMDIKNVEKLPVEIVSQPDLIKYVMSYDAPLKRLIIRVNWTEDLAIEFYNTHENKYANFIPNNVKNEKYIANKRKVGRDLSTIKKAKLDDNKLNKYIKELSINNLNVIREKKNDDYNLAQAIFLDFMTGNYNKTMDYCNYTHVSRERFLGALKIIKDDFNNLYNIYYELFKPNVDKLNNINELAEYIVKSLGDRNTKFTNLDYALLTDLPINLIYPEILKITKFEEYPKDSKDPIIIKKIVVAREIVARYRQLCTDAKNTDLINLKSLYLNGRRMNAKRVLSMDEMNSLFIFMRRNGLNINNVTFKIVLDSYINGLIDINKVYDKKIKTGYIDREQELLMEFNMEMNSMLQNDDVMGHYNKLHVMSLKKGR